MAIKSGTVGDEETLGRDPNPGHTPFAVGKFIAQHPDRMALCHIPEMTVAEFERGPVPTNRRLDPAVTLKHVWKNVRFLVTPAHTGVAFEADLTYTQDGCTAEYKVVGLSPAAECGTQLEPDQTKCAPEADGKAIRGLRHRTRIRHPVPPRSDSARAEVGGLLPSQAVPVVQVGRLAR